MSCHRTATAPADGLRRIAIPPAVVLIADASEEWLGLGCSIVLQYDLALSPAAVPLFALDDSAAYLSGAGERLDTSLSQSSSMLRLSAAGFDLTTQRSSPLLQAEAAGENGLLQNLNRLARQLDPAHAQSFSTRNAVALKAFVQAVSAPDANGRAQLLKDATQLDPGFGLAQIALAETVGPSALTSAHPESFTPFDRARWTAISARLRQEPAAAQIAAQANVLKLAPNNVDALATLGTMQFLAGNRQPGEAKLRQAIILNPANLALRVQLQQLLQGQAPPH